MSALSFAATTASTIPLSEITAHGGGVTNAHGEQLERTLLEKALREFESRAVVGHRRDQTLFDLRIERGVDRQPRYKHRHMVPHLPFHRSQSSVCCVQHAVCGVGA